MSAHPLAPQRLVRRCADTFKPAFNIINYHSTIPSFLREKYHIFFGDLLERLKVDMTIMDYNYTRLNQYLRMLVYEQIRVLHLRLHEIQQIDEKEYPLTLKFFLQFDVNMFNMKTYSFRYTRPRTLNEGLFCIREPDARYELAACVKLSCHTRNIIYALTCPCGKHDYIGVTTQSLHDRLRKHREHGNRIMDECLLREENIKSKHRMKLYQHSARCPVAMQFFLDANPQYWRFVPMTLEESTRPEQQMVTPYTFSEEFSWTIRSKEDTKVYVDAVPKPPKGLTFFNRQIMLQTRYFHKTRDRTLPNQDIDVYDATILAVLPETCSDMFRFTIESLFITYAETNLNSIGNVLNANQNGDHYPMNDPWLKHRVLFDCSMSTLLHPPKPVWSSKRLDQVQERRPIKDPIFIYLNPMDIVQYRSHGSSK
ncbi:unnamed protein product [Rotaria sordida]|uniref:GIY-YIG domain-containing protein n=2 Tax=Rotaria sordida TaxID=392033 RepID=A0A815VED2_9BILA|nr:unnamed protein product [Rotaria sordida]CAF1529064.1 unnamed protein product [Rotaria sordida]